MSTGMSTRPRRSTASAPTSTISTTAIVRKPRASKPPPPSSTTISKPLSTRSNKPPSSSTKSSTAKPRRKKAQTGGDPDAPGEDEWAGMEVFGRFVVTDDEGHEHSFRVGDTAAILPATAAPGVKIPPHEYWVVKIKAIRGRLRTSPKSNKRNMAMAMGEELDVWVKIQWYYSPQDVAALVKGFAPSHCAIYERIYSNHSETISARTFEGAIDMRKFHETDPEQAPIASDLFFCRYFLDVPKAQISLYVPKVKGTALPSLSLSTRKPTSRAAASPPVGCICDYPYDVQDTDPLRVMHMCPRASCSRYFHRRCLMTNGWWMRKDGKERRLSPHAEEVEGKEKEEENADSGCSILAPDLSRPHQNCDCHSSQSSALPPALLRLAALPIVRGAAIPRVGIEGIGYAVSKARRLLSEQNVSAIDGWEALVGLDTAAIEELIAAANPLIVQQDTGAEVVLLCPGCREVI
ncbi:hypothetical protein C8F01DRAFT_1253899 [Mycena amicta]|nr:hypothetical protein C8F01DRAFT_1253899 [Mycena amicta]